MRRMFTMKVQDISKDTTEMAKTCQVQFTAISLTKLAKVFTPITPFHSLTPFRKARLLFPTRLVVIINTWGSIAITQEEFGNPLLLLLTQLIKSSMVTIINRATSEMTLHSTTQREIVTVLHIIEKVLDSPSPSVFSGIDY